MMNKEITWNPARSLISIIILFLLTTLIVSCGGGPTQQTPPPISKSLNVPPVIQQTPEWCWAAAAQMVLGYYGYPAINSSSPQCGIVAAVYGGQCAYNCASCVFGIASMTSEQYVIDNYGPFLSGYSLQYFPPLNSAISFSAINMNAVVDEIANNRPILVGINPSGGWSIPNYPAHASVLIGYDRSNGADLVIVNDPYPYWSNPTQTNPYLLAGATSPTLGQYKISYTSFVQLLLWNNTIYNIH